MDLRADIERLSRTDRQRKAFGALSHDYRVGAPLSDHEIIEFEARYRVSLPSEYRGYLQSTGNGGAGPFHGVFPLGQVDDNADLTPYDQSLLVGRLDRQFAYTDAWNLMPEQLEFPVITDRTSPDDQLRLIDEYDSRMTETYWSVEHVDGALPLCHRGCALRVWLVVSGPLAGTVWNDDRADNAGLYPLYDRCGVRMTFARWMSAWLKEPLQHTELLATGLSA